MDVMVVGVHLLSTSPQAEQATVIEQCHGPDISGSLPSKIAGDGIS